MIAPVILQLTESKRRAAQERLQANLQLWEALRPRIEQTARGVGVNLGVLEADWRLLAAAGSVFKNGRFIELADMELRTVESIPRALRSATELLRKAANEITNRQRECRQRTEAIKKEAGEKASESKRSFEADPRGKTSPSEAVLLGAGTAAGLGALVSIIGQCAHSDSVISAISTGARLCGLGAFYDWLNLGTHGGGQALFGIMLLAFGAIIGAVESAIVVGVITWIGAVLLCRSRSGGHAQELADIRRHYERLLVQPEKDLATVAGRLATTESAIAELTQLDKALGTLQLPPFGSTDIESPDDASAQEAPRRRK